MKDSAYTIKTTIIMVLLAIESKILTTTLLNYIKTQDYFTPPVRTLGNIGLLLLLILITYSLSVGSWKKWEQYIVVPLPIALGIFIGAFDASSTYAFIGAIVAYIIIGTDVKIATHVRDILIKFDARVILKSSANGFLNTFALLSAALVFAHSSGNTNTFNIGETIGEIAQDQMGSFLPTLSSNDIPAELLGSIPLFNTTIKETVTESVNTRIEPYAKFIPPLIALLVYGIVKFLSTIVLGFFYLIVPGIFWVALKVGWFNTKTETVQKESLTFLPTNSS